MNLQNCPRCGAKALMFGHEAKYVGCSQPHVCGLEGPAMDTAEEAVREWNRVRVEPLVTA